MLRFMVIGTGFGQNHLDWLAACDSASIAVLCYHENKSRAIELADRYGIPTVSADPARIISEGRVDAVTVVSPPDTHETLLRLALSAGLLVVTDKPLTSDIGAAGRLAELARVSSARSVVTFQWRVNPALRRLRKVRASGVLGTVVRADLEFHHDFLSSPSTSWPWRHKLHTAGAGTLGDQGVHLFDLLRWLVPGDWSVSGGLASVVWPQRRLNGGVLACETEDVAEVLLTDTAGPARARVLVSRVSAGYRAVRVLVQGTMGVAIVSASPDDGSATLTVFSARENSPAVIGFGPNSMNPYQTLLAELGHEQQSSELADIGDGYLAQVLLEEALSRGCGKPNFVEQS